MIASRSILGSRPGRRTAPRTCARRAFSLIELLLSVFILAIGIISVSALFPAGIAQQQQSADDLVGPVIAEQAIGLLRSRVAPEDFGSFEEFGVGTDANGSGSLEPGERLITRTTGAGSYVFRPAPGDWSWIRPGVIRQDQPGTPGLNEVGAIDIFATLAQNQGSAQQEFCEFPSGIATGNGVTLYGAPYNTARTAFAPPIIVTQRERWWPSVPENATAFSAPQYAWDCMFRRSSGKVQVAIFVYRVVGSGGARKAYTSPANGTPAFPADVTNGAAPELPPVPFRRTLVVPSGLNLATADATGGPATGNQVLIGWQQPATLALNQQTPFTTGLIKDGTATAAGGPGQGLLLDDFPADRIPRVHQQWQYPGQWVVDNNGNVHRVVQGRRNRTDPPLVRFAAPVPRTQNAQVFDDYELRPPVGGGTDPAPQGVRTLHYVPTVIDANGTQLVPVYATVRDL